MARALAWGAVLAVSAIFAGGAGDAAPKQKTDPLNPANEALLQLPPPERAARLALAVGNWCIGTEAFLMGVLASGPGAGNAYWSLRCADGTAWAVQIDPHYDVTAIDCGSFKEAALGKECFKKF